MEKRTDRLAGILAAATLELGLGSFMPDVVSRGGTEAQETSALSASSRVSTMSAVAPSSTMAKAMRAAFGAYRASSRARFPKRRGSHKQNARKQRAGRPL